MVNWSDPLDGRIVGGNPDEVARQLRLAEQFARDGEQYMAAAALWDARIAASRDPAALSRILESANRMLFQGRFAKGATNADQTSEAHELVSGLVARLGEDIDDAGSSRVRRVRRRAVAEFLLPVVAVIWIPLFVTVLLSAQLLAVILRGLDGLVARLVGPDHNRLRLLVRLEGWIEAHDDAL